MLLVHRLCPKSGGATGWALQSDWPALLLGKVSGWALESGGASTCTPQLGGSGDCTQRSDRSLSGLPGQVGPEAALDSWSGLLTGHPARVVDGGALWLMGVGGRASQRGANGGYAEQLEGG